MTKSLLPWILLLLPFLVKGQQFLQLETINDAETKKYPLGTSITLKTKQLDEWQTIKTESFLYDDQTIVYDGGLLHLEDITAVLEHRTAVNVLSRSLTTFGTAWLVFGLFTGKLDKDENTGYSDLAIGVSSVAAGWALRKAFYKRSYKMGSRYRLRLIDLRMDVK